MPLVSPIEIDHIPCQKPSHEGREPWIPRSEKKMGMVREKGPGVAGGICGGQKIGETIHHIIAIVVVSEYVPAFNAMNDHMVDHAGDIESCKSGHDGVYIGALRPCQVIYL